MWSCLCSTIANFSFRHNIHGFVAVLYDWCIPRISHDISTFLFYFFSFQISLESSVCFIFSVFKRFSMACALWLELGLTDAVVNFISIILCRWSYICLVQNVITEKLTVSGAFRFVYTATCSFLSWWLWLWVCHCLVVCVDSLFHVCHTVVVNFHIVSVEDFRKLMMWWKSVC